MGLGDILVDKSGVLNMPYIDTIIQCPACGVSRDINDVIVTYESTFSAGKEWSEKKTVRTLISVKILSNGEDRVLSYSCGVCEHDWIGDFGGPQRPIAVADGDSAFAAVQHIFHDHTFNE